MITNSGSQRFDLYSGPFTKNDQFTVSPFTDAFLFIPNVTLSIAKQVLPALNGVPEASRRSLSQLKEREEILYGRGYVDKRYMEWLEEMDRRGGVERRAAENLTLGYVTHDVSFASLCVIKIFKVIPNDPVLSWCWGRHFARAPSIQPNSKLHRL
jgi:hypothetical protein